MVEVFIGGWENSKSVIRKNRTKPDRAETPTQGILSAGEYRGFWIRWNNGVSWIKVQAKCFILHLFIELII